MLTRRLPDHAPTRAEAEADALIPPSREPLDPAWAEALAQSFATVRGLAAAQTTGGPR